MIAPRLLNHMLHDGRVVIVHSQNATLINLVGLVAFPLGVSTRCLLSVPRSLEVQFGRPRGRDIHLDWSKAEPSAPRLDARLQNMLRIVGMIDEGDGRVKDRRGS